MSAFKMIGWDFKDSQRLFEKVAAMSEESIDSLMKDASITNFIVLSTCNRFEIYYDGKSRIDPIPLETQRSLSGREAVEHLFLVSSGLESLSLGENEILGQLKESYEKALQKERSTSVMSSIFRKAISCGKDVRYRTGISAGRVSIPSYCGQVVYSTYRGNGKRISIVGSGKMSKDILKYVMEGKPSSITVYGRNDQAIEPIRQKFPEISYSILPEMEKVVQDSDIIIFATTSKKPLLLPEHFVSRDERKHILDVSVPTNVDYSVDSLENVKVMRLNDIEPVIKENMEWKRKLIDEARSIVEEHTDIMMSKLRELESEYIIAEIYSFARSIAETEADEFRRSLNSGQDTETALDGLVNSIVNKLLHPQTAAIKELIRKGGAQGFLDTLRSFYIRDGDISVSDYSSPEDRGGRRNRRVQIHQSDHKP